MVSDASQLGPGDQQLEEATAGTKRRSSGRRRWAVLGAGILVGAAAVSIWRSGAFAPVPPRGSGSQVSATAVVVRQDIAATTPVTATLGYAGSYLVRGHGSGTLTWLPSPGQVMRQGVALYKVDNGSPVVLLYGHVPVWRSLAAGDAGQDVAQLNHDLVTLRDVDRASIAALGWSYFSWETAAAVAKLQLALGAATPSGSLPLGSVVFAPQALRVSRLAASLGDPAGGPVLAATSDRHIVAVPLDVSQESAVRVGDKVTVTLPDGTTTPGAVTSVGTVAATSGAAGSATIPVQVSLTDQVAAGLLDQAPVTVNITTAAARHALVVPVTALLAQSTGQYTVEVIGPRETPRWVRVTPGIFDDASGLVQVTGALAPGQRVVVASS